MAEQMTGAEMVIEALADQGVEHIFGYPGGAVLPIYDAMTLFASSGIRQSGVRDVQMASFNGTAPALDLVREGDIAADRVGGDDIEHAVVVQVHRQRSVVPRSTRLG